MLAIEAYIVILLAKSVSKPRLFAFGTRATRPWPRQRALALRAALPTFLLKYPGFIILWLHSCRILSIFHLSPQQTINSNYCTRERFKKFHQQDKKSSCSKRQLLIYALRRTSSTSRCTFVGVPGSPAIAHFNNWGSWYIQYHSCTWRQFERAY